MTANKDIKARVEAFLARIRRIDSNVARSRDADEETRRRLGEVANSLDQISDRLEILSRNNTVLMEAFASTIDTGTKRFTEGTDAVQKVSAALDRGLLMIVSQVAELDRRMTERLTRAVNVVEANAARLERQEAEMATAPTRVEALTRSDAEELSLRGVQNLRADLEGIRDTFGREVGDLKASVDRLVRTEWLRGELDALTLPINRIQSRLNWDLDGPNAEDQLRFDPELVMLTALGRYFQSASMVDVGAHEGDYSAPFLDLGFEVVALEPNPVVFERLQARMATVASFKALKFAVGSSDGNAALYLASDRSESGVYRDPTLFSSLVRHSMPDDLRFEGKVWVQVRSLASLVEEGQVPSSPGILKIDVEGMETQVLEGAQGMTPEVVVVEFWSSDSLFGGDGANNAPDNLREVMRNLGYSDSITFARRHGLFNVGYLVNTDETPPNSWGNMVFFRDTELFRRALTWCGASLKRTTLTSAESSHWVMKSEQHGL